MNKLVKSILVIILLFAALTIKGQIIPLEWEGIWHGTVDIWAYNVKTDSFPVFLEREE